MTKKQILLQRGFSKHDIETNFADYNGEWNIKTITKEQVIAAKYSYQLKPLFYMDSVEYNRWCCTDYGYKFASFAEDIPPFGVSPSELDPYIARLCNAVNSIGAKTCMSCDGWHMSSMFYTGKMMLFMQDRYSVIWFWLITEYIFGEYWQHNHPLKYDWSNVWEPFDYENDGLGGRSHRDMIVCRYLVREAKQVFGKQDRYASFIEKHKDEFLLLRDQLIKTLYEKMDNKEIRHIDTVGFMKARRYMCDIFVPLAAPLKEAFKCEHYQVYTANSNKCNYAY